MPPGPKYPNQQLRAVSLEAYFPGRFSLWQSLPTVQEAFEDRFPDVLVPNAQPGEALDLKPFVLRAQDQTERLELALNQVAYRSFDYPGHAAFAERALPIIQRCLELAKVSSLNRVAYKYENEIGLTGEGGRAPVSQILKITLPDGTDPAELMDVDYSWQRAWEHGEAFGALGLANNRERAQVLRLVLAAQVNPAGPVDRLGHFAELAHREALSSFENMITDEFRELLAAAAEAEEEEREGES